MFNMGLSPGTSFGGRQGAVAPVSIQTQERIFEALHNLQSTVHSEIKKFGQDGTLEKTEISNKMQTSLGI